MTTKDKAFTMRMTEGRKWALEVLAKKHEMPLSRFLQKAGTFYGSFPPEFLEEIDKVAGETGLTSSTIIIHTLQKQFAAARAWQKVFDTVPCVVHSTLQMNFTVVHLIIHTVYSSTGP